MKIVNAQQAKEMLDKNEVILIDVREKDEFEAEHIAGAKFFPLSNFSYDVSKIDSSGKKIIFQCKAGGRSAKACDIAKNVLGSDEIYNLEGGIGAWKAAGFNTETPSNKKACTISIFRQVQIVVGALVFVSILLGLSGFTGFYYLAGALGLALFIAGFTGWCGLAILLNKMPWNKS